MLPSEQEDDMLGIFSDVFKRATYQDLPHPEQRGDWHPPTHWRNAPPVRKGARHD